MFAGDAAPTRNGIAERVLEQFQAVVWGGRPPRLSLGRGAMWSISAAKATKLTVLV